MKIKIYSALSIIFIYTLNATDPQIIQSMSLKEKIGSLIIAAAVSNEEHNKEFMAMSPYRMDKEHVEDLIKNYHVGGIIFLGTTQSTELTNRIKHFQSLRTQDPLLIALDAEWPAMRIKNLPTALQLPHHMTLGALSNLSLIEEAAYITGCILRHCGVHINLAPVADVNNNPENPVINDRSFGSNPMKVAQRVIAYVNGLARAGIMDCVKHFPGHGDTTTDSHFALPVISHTRERLDAIELFPFRAAIAGGAKAMMIGHIQLPQLDPQENTPATLSKKIITDLLRKELGFNGLIFTDGLGMKGVTDYYQSGELEVRTLEAGADVILCPVNVRETIAAIETAVQSGRLSEKDIDEKLERIRQVKQWIMNQQDKPLPDIKDLLLQSGQLKKQIYEKAITVVKDTAYNTNNVTINVTNMNKFKFAQFGITNQTLELIKKTYHDIKAINGTLTVVLYGSPYAVELVKDYADRVIVAYEDDPYSHAAVTNLLKGAIKAEGVLPV